VAAAFTLKPALDAIAAGYRRRGGAVTLVYGPSPVLAKEIEDGLPADVFFSADPAWVAELERHGLVAPAAVDDVVGNRLVLIARRGAQPSGTLTPDFPLARLLGAGPLAMCNPDSDPAGRYAEASLIALGLWQGVEARVARAQNPLAAVELVARGEAPFAIVFATDAGTDARVAIVGTFPDDSHPPIRDPVAVLAHHPDAGAVRFVDYLRSADATAVFRRLGYVILDRSH
jgi:molybdate transport system substrate-binding protein